MFDDNNFDDLLTDDPTWWKNFGAALVLLGDWSADDLTLVEIDDVIGSKTYVPCARRGTHIKITECWLCFGDWAWGCAPLSELLAPEEQEQ